MKRTYKDSGLAWVGNIPAEWKVEKGKAILTKLERPVLETDNVITCFRDGEVTLRSNRREDGFTISMQETGYQGIEVDDLVIHGMDGFAGAIGISDSRGKGTPVLNVLDSKQNKRFLMYYLRNMAYTGVFLALSTGIRVRSCDTNWNKLKNLMYVLPPLEEQEKISRYLDNECLRIDLLASKTKESIESYKKLRQAIITQAIKEGLRPEKNLIDTNIDWIGMICDRYSLCRLKYLLASPLMYGANESGVEYEESLPRYIRITDITMDGKLKDINMLSLPEEAASSYILKDNDLLFARSGASVGKAFLYRKEYGRAAFAGYLIKAEVNEKILPEYLFYYTQSSLYEEWKKQIFIQATIQNIGADRYNSLPVILPNIEEQEEIVEYVKRECKKIDSIIEKKMTMLSELEKQKKAMIYECVTGKKEV